MTKEKMKRMDTGRVIEKDLKQPSSKPVPKSELVAFHTCGPPDCQFGKLTELHKIIGSRNFAKLYQEANGMHVAVSTSTVETQTLDDQLEALVSGPITETQDLEVQAELGTQIVTVTEP